MDRRKALRYSGWIAGTGLLAPGVLAALQSCRNAPANGTWEPESLTDDQVNQLTLLSDTIIPATKTPSASEVRVFEFVDLLMADVLAENQNQSIMDGLRVLDEISQDQSGQSFVDINSEERLGLLNAVDMEAFDKNPSGDFTTSFLTDYRYLKTLILMAYFTSEEGVRQNLNYVVIPGDYTGCMDLPEDGRIQVGNHM